MNIASIYGKFDQRDRDIIIEAMNTQAIKFVRGIKLRHVIHPTHTTLAFFDADMIYEAVDRDIDDHIGMMDEAEAEDESEADKITLDRMHRICELIDGLLNKQETRLL